MSSCSGIILYKSYTVEREEPNTHIVGSSFVNCVGPILCWGCEGIARRLLMSIGEVLTIFFSQKGGGLVFPALYYGESHSEVLMEANADDRERRMGPF